MPPRLLFEKQLPRLDRLLLLGNVERDALKEQRPTLLVVAEATNADAIRRLFSRRGFLVVMASNETAVADFSRRGDADVSAAIIDFSVAGAVRILSKLHAVDPLPILVAIAPAEQVAALGESVDEVFSPPVDRARIFVRVVELVAERKKGKLVRKITGLIGNIPGNPLFRAVETELCTVVPPVNAGAILEGVLRDLDVEPFALRPVDVAALLASGRLHTALAAFAAPPAIEAALARIGAIVEANAPGPSGATARRA